MKTLIHNKTLQDGFDMPGQLPLRRNATLITGKSQNDMLRDGLIVTSVHETVSKTRGRKNK